MKKILIILLLLTTTFTFSQEEIPIQEEITQAERLIDKYSAKAENKVNQIMSDVKPMAIEGFSMVVKLQRAKGVAYLLVFPFFIIGWLLFNKYYLLAKAGDNCDWVDNAFGLHAILTLVISTCLTLGLIPALYHGLLFTMAPEWYAIKEISELF
jgi:hypothetical protein